MKPGEHKTVQARILEYTKDNKDDPYLIAMAERAIAVQEAFEGRQLASSEALAELARQRQCIAGIT